MEVDERRETSCFMRWNILIALSAWYCRVQWEIWSVTDVSNQNAPLMMNLFVFLRRHVLEFKKAKFRPAQSWSFYLFLKKLSLPKDTWKLNNYSRPNSLSKKNSALNLSAGVEFRKACTFLCKKMLNCKHISLDRCYFNNTRFFIQRKVLPTKLYVKCSTRKVIITLWQ